MIDRQLLKQFSNSLNLTDNLLEKEIIIYLLIIKISGSTYLRSNLVFKGGTCLTKTYVPHYRFSEDIDFGWRDQSSWETEGARATEKKCLHEMKSVISIMKEICDEIGLHFNPSIDEMEDVFISNSGTRLTIHLNYISTTSGKPDRVKMEVNFLDLFLFSFEERTLMSILDRLDRRAAFLFPQIDEYRQPATLTCYSIKEIFVEKMRASLTRVEYKIRDTIDMAMIQRKFNLDLYDFEDGAFKKIEFVVSRFSRYSENLKGPLLPESVDQLEKEMILLIDRRPKDLMPRMVEINKHLNQLKGEMIRKMKVV